MDCTTGSGKLIDRPDSVPAEPAGELSYLCFWPIGTAQVAQWTSLLPVNKDITVGICSLLLDHMNYFTTAEAQCLWWTLALQYSLNMAINAQPKTEIRDQIVNYIWQWQLPWLFTNQAYTKIPRYQGNTMEKKFHWSWSLDSSNVKTEKQSPASYNVFVTSSSPLLHRSHSLFAANGNVQVDVKSRQRSKCSQSLVSTVLT